MFVRELVWEFTIGCKPNRCLLGMSLWPPVFFMLCQMRNKGWLFISVSYYNWHFIFGVELHSCHSPVIHRKTVLSICGSVALLVFSSHFSVSIKCNIGCFFWSCDCRAEPRLWICELRGPEGCRESHQYFKWLETSDQNHQGKMSSFIFFSF